MSTTVPSYSPFRSIESRRPVAWISSASSCDQSFVASSLKRVVFLPYTAEMYERSQRWMQEHRLFEERAKAPAFESVVQV